MQRFSVGSIVIVDEGDECRTQIFLACEASIPHDAAIDYAKDDFDLVQPETVLGRVHKANVVSRIGRDGSVCDPKSFDGPTTSHQSQKPPGCSRRTAQPGGGR